MQRPDALVLGGGGTLGIAWLRGLAAGLAEGGVDLRGAEYIVGTSAGAVIGAHLAAGLVDDAGTIAQERADDERPPPRGAASGREDAAGRGRLAVATSALLRASAAAAQPVAPLAFALGRPGGAALRAAALATVPAAPGRSLDGLRSALAGLDARFDGRLRVTAVDRRRGRRVVFGEPGAPRATVTDAVLASCAVPWMFAPVTIGGREYVDGGAWSPSNIDVVPVGRGAEVLVLLPIAGGRARSGLLNAMRAGARAAAQAEAQVLRARGARVRIIHPDADARAAIGPDYFDAGRRGEVMRAGVAQGRTLTHRVG